MPVEGRELVNNVARDAPCLFHAHVGGEHDEHQRRVTAAMPHRREAELCRRSRAATRLDLEKFAAYRHVPGGLVERAAHSAVVASHDGFSDVANRVVIGADDSTSIELLEASGPNLKEFPVGQVSGIDHGADST